MNVPKYMIEKMYRANRLISEGNSLINEINQYLYEKGSTEETIEEISRNLECPHNESSIKGLVELLKGE